MMSSIDLKAAKSQEYWNAAPWNGFTKEELRKFLTELKKIVPIVNIQNGLEYYRDYAPPDHPSVKGDILLRNASELLYYREIEARLDRDAAGIVDWRDNERVDSRYFSHPLAVEESGLSTGPLSFDDHARGYFKSVFAITTMISSLESLAEDPVLRERIRSYCVSIGMAGFNAGVHYRAALGKQIEPSALTGMKINRGNAERRDTHNRRQRDRVNARRRIIYDLATQTNREGGALIKWLSKILEQQVPPVKVSERTIRADLKALGEMERTWQC